MVFNTTNAAPSAATYGDEDPSPRSLSSPRRQSMGKTMFGRP